MTPQRTRWITSSFAVFALALAACGSAKQSSSPATNASSTTAASKPPKVIHVAGGGANGGNAPMAATADASGDSVRSGLKMRPYYSVTYQYSGTPPDLTSPMGSWYFSPDNKPTQEQIAALAKALGVVGDVRQLPDDQGGGWMVGPDDYSAATLTVSNDALFDWYYSPAPSALDDSGGCAISTPVEDPNASDGSGSAIVPPDTAIATDDTATDDTASDDTSDSCEPQPPAGVPTEAEARAKTEQLFTALGIDINQYKVDVYADEWSAGVNASLVLDGIQSSVTVSTGFGGGGELNWASGFLGTPQQGGDYDRIGVDAGIKRLNDQAGQFMAYGGIADGTVRSDAATTAAGVGASEPAIAVPDTAPAGTDLVPTDIPMPIEPICEPLAPTPDPSTSDTATSDTATSDTATSGTGDDVVTTDIATDCGPIDTTPTVVTLTDAAPSLEQVWDTDGTVWLLPGYSFTADDGGIYSVIAVQDQYLQIDTPTVDTLVPDSTVDTAVPDTIPTVTAAVPPAVTDPQTVTSLSGTIPSGVVDTLPVTPAT